MLENPSQTKINRLEKLFKIYKNALKCDRDFSLLTTVEKDKIKKNI